MGESQWSQLAAKWPVGLLNEHCHNKGLALFSVVGRLDIGRGLTVLARLASVSGSLCYWVHA